MSEQKPKYGTPFLEAEALLAVSEDDEDYLDQVLAQLSPSELGRLEKNAQWLATYARSERNKRND